MTHTLTVIHAPDPAKRARLLAWIERNKPAQPAPQPVRERQPAQKTG
ncbi:hypothetical protein HLB42_21695 (plasmid) [Deinococcus sp. D7000]|nr:hypothetical protein HLB42_13970 [Deinococcus sp. D7000]QLG13556.1 hypothetical protein HLB42_21695 [Deinococcus sp. D7000]